MSVFSDSLWRIVSTAIQLCTSLFLGILSARLLGPAGKGQYYLIVQFSLLGSLLLGLGLGPSYQYHVARNLLSISKAFGHLLMLTLGFSVFLLSMYVALESVLSAYFSASHDSYIVPLALILLLLNVLITYISCLAYTRISGIRTVSLISTCAAAFHVMLFYYFVSDASHPVQIAVFLLVISIAVQMLILIYYIRPRFMVFSWVSLVDISKMLVPYSLSFLLGNVVVASIARFDVFLVNGFLGPAALGQYSVAVALAELMLIVPRGVGSTLFAHLPSMNVKAQSEKRHQAARLTLMVTVCLGIALALSARLLVLTLVGPSFLGAVGPLRLLAPGLVFMALNYILANYYAALGRPLVTAWCFLAGFLMNLALDLLLIPVAGIAGASISSSLAYFLSFAAFLVVAFRDGDLKLRTLLIPKVQDLRDLRAALHPHSGSSPGNPQI
ncbi:MAG: oligosaccharide flippase family protein [Thermoleophilia bacterium]